MDCSDSSDLSSVSPSTSSQTSNSSKTKTSDYEDSVPNYDFEDKNNIEAFKLEESKDSNVENRTDEELKIITPFELSDLKSVQSIENNAQSSQKERSFIKGQTPSLFNNMTYKQHKQKLLEIILMFLFLF